MGRGTLAYLQERGEERGAVHSGGSSALFAFGGELVHRPSGTCRYIVPDLEVEREAHDLVETFGTQRIQPLRIKVDADLGQLTISIIVREEVAEQALLELRRASGVWSLGDLGQWLSESWSLARWLGETSESAAVASPLIAGEPLPTQAAVEIDESEAPRESGALTPLPDDATVEQIATQLSELTRLSDGELGQLFPGEVSREHYQRWRTGKADNPTSANRRRMWFLVRLFERAALAGVVTTEWVRNSTEINELTPFELLRLGRFDDVEHLAARLAPAPHPVEITSVEGRRILLEQGPASFVPRGREPTSDLIIDAEEGEDIEGEVDDG